MQTLTLESRFQPAITFLRQAVTMRTALIAAGFLTFVSIALAAINMNVAFKCAGSEHLLVYPVYDKKGIVVDTVSRCGTVHRGCTLNESHSYDCSPFMAPKGTLGLR